MTTPLCRSLVEIMVGEGSRFGVLSRRRASPRMPTGSGDCTGAGGPTDRTSRRDASNADDDDVAREAGEDFHVLVVRVEQHEVLDPDPGLAVEIDARLDAEHGWAGERHVRRAPVDRRSL